MERSKEDAEALAEYDRAFDAAYKSLMDARAKGETFNFEGATLVAIKRLIDKASDDLWEARQARKIFHHRAS